MRDTLPGKPGPGFAFTSSPYFDVQHQLTDYRQVGDLIDHRLLIEHTLADRPGDWKVSIIGSQASDLWEMKISGPNGFERTYMLEGPAGECEPQAIARIVAKMVPRAN